LEEILPDLDCETLLAELNRDRTVANHVSREGLEVLAVLRLVPVVAAHELVVAHD
jgi:hypothetical protein